MKGIVLAGGSGTADMASVLVDAPRRRGPRHHPRTQCRCPEMGAHRPAGCAAQDVAVRRRPAPCRGLCRRSRSQGSGSRAVPLRLGSSRARVSPPGDISEANPRLPPAQRVLRGCVGPRPVHRYLRASGLALSLLAGLSCGTHRSWPHLSDVLPCRHFPGTGFLCSHGIGGLGHRARFRG